MPPIANSPRVRASLALAALVLALAGPAVEEAKAQSAATVQSCKNAWYSASARPTCTTVPNDILLSNGQCRIKKSCKYYGIGSMGVTQALYKANDVTVPLADVDDLHNCNGELQVGPC